ncbi:unnamed protein product [Effrenium voratum]|nr:unnamed protein product [Effrenium voratum]
MWVLLAGTLTFWSCLYNFSELRARLGCRLKYAFYDSACIDQSNEEAKMKGISQITAYLWHSNKLLILLSNNYFQRIWTVFELAAFLALKPYSPVLVESLDLAGVTASASLAGLFFRPCWRVMRWYFADWRAHAGWGGDAAGSGLLALAAGVLGFGVLIMVFKLLRGWGIMRARLQEQIENFTFAQARCSVENDRVEILSAVHHLAEESQMVEPGASVEEACAVLESRAKVLVPGCMLGALSTAGMPFKNAVMISLPRLMGILDDQSSLCREIWLTSPDPVPAILQMVLLTIALGFIALSTLTVTLFITRQKRQHCIMEVAITFCCTGAAIAGSVLSRGPLATLETPGLLNSAILVGISAIQGLLLWFCYGAGLPCRG